jgi:hypothetical protein
MAVRALIIAAENYPNAKGALDQNLPGTLQAGLNFKNWLLEKWKAEGREESETQVIFCSEPVQPGGSGATSKDIRNALRSLKQDGQGATEELYVFFSGHGFSFVEGLGNRADIVVSTDFEDADVSPHCCINLDQMVYWLRDHLGAGRHYYFIDACRNHLTGRQIQVGPLLPINPNVSGEPSTFILQSTVEGTVTTVGGPFPTSLLAGLRGKGKAKTWNSQVFDAMFVRYDSLRNYIKSVLPPSQKFTSKTSGTDGESDAILATLRPIPVCKCTITIKNPPPTIKGEIVYKRGRSGETHHALDGNTTSLVLEPDDYTISVRLEPGSGSLKPRDPVAVELYEDRDLVFERIEDEPAVKSLTLDAASVAKVDVVVPDQGSLTLHNLSNDAELTIQTSGPAKVSAGRYLATAADGHGRIFLRKEIEVVPGEPGELNITEWRGSTPHRSIVDQLPPYAVHPDGIDFSESLGGEVTDPDLDLWLALVGASRILGPTGDYSKLVQFPLHEFGGEQANASPIYMLAGFEDPKVRLQVGVSKNANLSWSSATQPPNMPGILEAFFSTLPGVHLVSFRIDDQAPYTVTTLASPNRGMLITFTVDDDGQPRISQFLLPFGHLLDELPNAVRRRIVHRNHLQDVRFIAQASRAFRKRRDLRKAVSYEELMELLYAKWLDPIASSLAAYEFLRRGQPGKIVEVVRNMKRYFPDLPDSAALAKLSGKRALQPKDVPLFFDGLRAFPNEDWLPLPASHLDFTSPWTAWRAAVSVRAS